MQYFRKIDLPWAGDFIPAIKDEIALNDMLWDVDQRRQRYVHNHKHTQSILLRQTKLHPKIPSEDVHEVETTVFANALPKTMEFLYRFSRDVNGELGRALLVRLAPDSVVYPHIDTGAYYAIRDRYHLVLASPGGSILRAGGEEVTMQNDELWWFDNKQMHESENRSDDWRTHLIFDVLPHAK